MKILKCDKCGHEERFDQIIGNEFENRGFETLTPVYRYGNGNDVCKKCYSDILKAINRSENIGKKLAHRLYLRILGIKK